MGRFPGGLQREDRLELSESDDEDAAGRFVTKVLADKGLA